MSFYIIIKKITAIAIVSYRLFPIKFAKGKIKCEGSVNTVSDLQLLAVEYGFDGGWLSGC